MRPFDRRTAADLAELIADEIFSFGTAMGNRAVVFGNTEPFTLGQRSRDEVEGIIKNALERPGDRPPTWSDPLAEKRSEDWGRETAKKAVKAARSKTEP